MIWRIRRKTKKYPSLRRGFLIFGNEFNFGFFDFWGRLVFLDKVAAVDFAVIHNIIAIFFDKDANASRDRN